MTDVITPKAATKPKQKAVSFKVPLTLFEELESLKSRVKKFNHEVDFNLDPALAESLRKHIRAANKSLDALEQ